MYSLIRNEKKFQIYDKLCDDVMGHIVGFLGDEEKVEWCHINKKIFATIHHILLFIFVKNVVII